MSLASGTCLSDRYEILAPLGAGGMGEVYRARDLRLGREVAVKVLPEHLSSDEQALSRFEREAKALATLNDPRIVAIYDFGKHEATTFAVMELLKGETLRSALAHTKPSWKKAVDIGTAIAEGLQSAHSAGIVHRDLKPENIFISSDGAIKILDFGLARSYILPAPGAQNEAPTISHATAPGIVMGTLIYMSPEQVRGENVDARTDIFSFGAVLYEMLTGSPAFARKTSADTISAILKEPPPPLSQSVKTVNPALESVVQHCLEKVPSKRFQSAQDLVFALKSNLNTSAVPSKPASSRKGKYAVAVVAVVLMITAAFLYQTIAAKRPIHSLAILPFTNNSQDPDTEYLTDGITGSIIDHLSTIPDLKVIARGTVFTFKGKQIDPRKLGRDLNVEALVTGNLTLRGNTLIINTELIRVSDGTRLWGERFDKELADVLAIEHQISKEISDKLQLKLSGAEQELVTKQYTTNSEAYQLFLKGNYYENRGSPEDYQNAIQYYQLAVEKDPKYALAYVGLAQTYVDLGFEGFMSPQEAFAKAQESADKAFEIDPKITGLEGPAIYRAIKEFKWTEVEALYRRGIEASPNKVRSLRIYATYLVCLGREEEALDTIQRALEIDPLSSATNMTLGGLYFKARKYDQAIAQLEKTIALDPSFPNAHDLLADVLERKGRIPQAFEQRKTFLNLIGDQEGEEHFTKDYEEFGYQEARKRYLQAIVDVLHEVSQEQYVSPVSFAQTYALLNDKDQAFAWLEKVYEERSPWLIYLGSDRQYDNIRSDPRFSDLLRRMHLPEVHY